MPSSILLADIVQYLDGYLRVREVPDEPVALNGLQAENSSGRVSRIVAAVDASLATILGTWGGATADEFRGSTLLLVHHGLFWDGNLPLTGKRYRRVRALLDGDVALYSAHIPLDIHPEVGNNHVLARQLGLSSIEPFESYRGVPIGVQGRLGKAVPREAFQKQVETLLGASSRLLAGGPEMSERIGIITGAAGGSIKTAREAGLDTYLSGEGPHHSYFDAMELGVNVIYAGHYATETVGVKALAQHCTERFGIAWEFHAHPTGM
ncbi:MAG TPA: Nif3-like dinuclear metal center hexameric protein [Gemmatimonadales bacterium]